MIHKKKALTLFTIALCVSCLATGCRKKHEKLDVAESTAAETMAPQTSAASESAGADDAAPETTAPADKNEAGGNSASGAKNVKADTETYSSGNISIEYPVVSNLDSAEKQAAVNELLKKNALSFLKANEIDEAKDTVTVKCTVLSADRKRITVTYRGTAKKKGGAYPTNVFYSNTVDVNKVSNLRLSHFADPYTMAGYVLSGDCVFPEADDAAKKELMKFKNEESVEYYTDLFSGADFPFTDTFPSSFSYEQDGDIYFSIPVPHALGDYAIVAYTPETK